MCGWDHAGSIPVGWGYRPFGVRAYSTLGNIKLRFRSKAERLLRRRLSTPQTYPPVSLDGYKDCLDIVKGTLKKKISDLDAVVINAEGTLHDDQPTALALVAVAEVASELRKHVAVVNGTITRMDNDILQRLARAADAIVIREPKSHREIAHVLPDAVVGADALFMAESPPRSRQQESVAVAYTPGVMSLYGALGRESVKKSLIELQAQHPEVHLLTVEREDHRFESVAKSLGVTVTSLEDSNAAATIQALRSFKQVDSGRYHICIYCVLAGVPFRPLVTNTGKIDGLLEHLGAVPDEKKYVHFTSQLDGLVAAARLNVAFARAAA